MNKSLIEAERDYILECPFIKDIFKVNVNYLKEDIDSFSVIQIPCSPLISEDIMGNKTMQSMFGLVGRLNYSENMEDNIKNMALFEKFQEWIDDNNENGILPELSEGLTPLEVNIISNGYISETGADLDDAAYQIEMQLIYIKEV